jgi:hypothetical protein
MSKFSQELGGAAAGHCHMSTEPRKPEKDAKPPPPEREHDQDSDPPRTAVPPGQDKPLRDGGRQEGC